MRHIRMRLISDYYSERALTENIYITLKMKNLKCCRDLNLIFDNISFDKVDRIIIYLLDSQIC